MKLYIYDHCPFCVKARSIFGLKNIAVEEEIVMEGDDQTPISLVGKKTVPILETEELTHMAESMDIVRYIDENYGMPLFTEEADAEIEDWCKEVWKPMLNLVIPRFTKADFPELATGEARLAYTQREIEQFGDLEAMFKNSDKYIDELIPLLDELSTMLERKHELNICDIELYAILRSLTIVKDLEFPNTVKDYIYSMEDRTRVKALFDRAL